MTDSVDEEKRTTLRRFAALGAATPFVGSAAGSESDPADENETREAIRGYVATTPGAHFSKLRDDLKLGTGEAQYHLERLADRGDIVSVKDGDYRRLFLAGRFDAFERTALGYLRRRTPRSMILELLRNPESGASALATAAGVSRASISATAGELESAGLLDRDDGYHLRRPETIALLVVQFASSFDDEAIAFADDADRFLTYDPEN